MVLHLSPVLINTGACMSPQGAGSRHYASREGHSGKIKKSSAEANLKD